ncbi:MAG: FecR domain-containing protein [Sphingopyxis sp.]|nr:FecR domain-containing protein [Sphingopyxis sp.]
MTDAPRGGTARSAAEWFVVMRGPDADSESRAFEDWRATSANADAYARFEATWNDSRFLANSSVGRDRDLSRARRKVPPAALLAAGVALLTLLSASLLSDHMGWLGPAAVQQPAATRIAAGDIVRTVRLPDGSRVTIDRGALLSDRSTAGERRFVLLRGRARFEVAHDLARPFTVDAGEGRVVAHGTIFDVGIEGGGVRVILLKGSVEVRDRNAVKSEKGVRRFLAPGEQLVVVRGEVGAPSRASPIFLSWPDAMISFDDTPLAEAVGAFNKIGGRTVRLESGWPTSQRVSGAFRRDDPQGFADALAASFGMEVEAAADGSLVLRPAASGATVSIRRPLKKSQG